MRNVDNVDLSAKGSNVDFVDLVDGSNVDNVVSRAGVGRRLPPFSTQTTFTDPRARDNKVNISADPKNGPAPLPADVLELATLLRETFGPLRISGRLVGKPDPEWTRWPSHTAADMARAPWRPRGPG